MNPLDQLADIATPDGVSIWPLALGYWLSLGVIVAIIAFGIIAFVKYRNKRKVKRESLLALALLDISDEYYAHRVQVIMKSLCSHYLPLSSSSQLHGKQWHTLVLSIYQGKETSRLTQVIDNLYQALYSPEQKADQNSISQNKLIQLTIKEWITASFPCKKVNINQADFASLGTARTGEVHNV